MFFKRNRKAKNQYTNFERKDQHVNSGRQKYFKYKSNGINTQSKKQLIEILKTSIKIIATNQWNTNYRSSINKKDKGFCYFSA